MIKVFFFPRSFRGAVVAHFVRVLLQSTLFSLIKSWTQSSWVWARRLIGGVTLQLCQPVSFFTFLFPLPLPVSQAGLGNDMSIFLVGFDDRWPLSHLAKVGQSSKFIFTLTSSVASLCLGLDFSLHPFTVFFSLCESSLCSVFEGTAVIALHSSISGTHYFWISYTN